MRDDDIYLIIVYNKLFLIINNEISLCRSLILFIYDNFYDKYNIDLFNIFLNKKIKNIEHLSKSLLLIGFINYSYKNIIEYYYDVFICIE
jgi:hypothetical protein